MKSLRDDVAPMTEPEKVSQNARIEAFIRELSREQDFIAAYIRSLLPHAADADDVLQQCNLLLWQKFSQFDGERSFRAWACGVAYYEVCNFLRSANRRRLQFNQELMSQIADQRLAEADRRTGHLSLLQACLKLLKSSDQELIREVYGKAHTASELAELQGMTVRSLQNRIWRLRKLLYDCVHRKLSLEESGDA